MKIENIVGWSIYPVAWLILIITKLINGEHNVFDIPVSEPFYLLLAFVNFSGLSFLVGFGGLFIILILTWVNFIIYKKISSVNLREFRFIILLAVYVLLVLINAHNDDSTLGQL